MLMICWYLLMQGNFFLATLSRSAMLRAGDTLTVLDLSENAIADDGAATLAAVLGAAGKSSTTTGTCVDSHTHMAQPAQVQEQPASTLRCPWLLRSAVCLHLDEIVLACLLHAWQACTAP